LKHALVALPVSLLRLPADTLEMLSRLGIATIKQLIGLSRVALAERFGAQLLLRLDQSFGLADEIIVPYRPAPTFEAAFRLEYPTDRRDVIDWIMAKLVERITLDLQARCVGAVRLAGQFDCEADKAVTFSVGLFRPSATAKQLQDLLKLHCERLVLSAPVERVVIRADQTAPLEYRQGEFFADPTSDANQHLAILLERLSSRLGPEAVLRPKLNADALPERALRYESFVGQRKSRGAKEHGSKGAQKR